MAKQIIDSSLRGPATPKEILEAVADRLRDQIYWCKKETCFVADQPTPLMMPAGQMACTVAFSSGSFDVEQWEAAHLLDTLRALVVTPILRISKDYAGRADFKLLGEGSLLQMETDVLTALLDADWEPAEGQRPLLKHGTLVPVRIEGPSDIVVGEAQCVASRISFMAPFQWKLG